MQGLIAHDGSKQPVSDETQVSIVCRGDANKNIPEHFSRAGMWRWDHRGNDSDIIFYKLKS